MLRPYSWILVACVAASWACKTRDPDSGGLLDSEPEAAGDEVDSGIQPAGGIPQETVAAEGDWHVSCVPADAGSKPNAGSTYILTVQGAARPDDDTQPLRVSLGVDRGKGAEPLGQGEMGRGAVDPRGPIFIGFESGVLTADYNTKMANASHLGVLTLAQDKDADALSVACRVERSKGGTPF